MTSAPALRLAGVGLVMGGARVLDDVSFDLAAGETLAIVGESGSGKTRIARLAGGLATPTSGAVSVFGADPMLGSTGGRKLGMTLQGGSLFDALGIDDNLRLGAGVTSDAGWRALATRVDRLLYEFGLEDLAEAPAGTLPIGAKRLLEVVRALLCDPALLILDEPFEGAAAHIASMAGAIRRSMRRRGGAILVVTQDEALAAALADRRLHLRHGRLVQQVVQQVFQQSDVVSAPAATSAATADATAATLA